MYFPLRHIFYLTEYEKSQKFYDEFAKVAAIRD